jgi:hypothetical protein
MSTLTIKESPRDYRTKHSGGEKVSVYDASGTGVERLLVYSVVPHRDFDGAPDSYAPPKSATDLSPLDPLIKGRDKLGNARDKANAPFKEDGKNDWQWTGVKRAKTTEPMATAEERDERLFLKDKNERYPVKVKTGSDKGYYVPRGAFLTKNGKPVNPLTVHFGVVSGELAKDGFSKGDYGVVIRISNSKSAAFFFADAAGKSSKGVAEFSEAVYQTLGKPSSEKICVFAFKGTTKGSPAQADTIEEETKKLIAKLGDFTNVDDLIEKLTTDAGEKKKIKDVLKNYGYIERTPTGISPSAPATIVP